MARGARVARVGLMVLAGLVLVVAIGFGILVATFNPNAYKPRIEAAIRGATGRNVALNGPIGLSFLPRPGITLRDVALANPPGFAGPDMATVRAITVRVDLGALLRRDVVVRRLVLDHPDIVLERNAAGVGNWQMPPPAKRAPAGPPAPAQSAGRPARFAVLNAELLDGSVTYRDDRTKQTFALSIPRVIVSAASPDAPAHVEADMTLAGTRYSLKADTGPLTGLAAGDPWPVRASATAHGPGQDVALEVIAAGADKPVAIAAKGTLRNTGFALTASLGAPALLPGTAPYAVSLNAEAAGARLAMQGKIAQPARLAGVDLALSADIPDLAALSPLAGRPLPTLKAVKVTGQLSDTGGLSKGVALRSLHVTAQPGDLSGSLEVAFAPRPSVRADLSGPRLDLDALRGAAPAPAAAKAPAPAPPPARPASGHVIPDTPIPFASLRAADADLHLKVGALRAGAMTWGNTDTHVTLADGALGLSARGTLDGKPVALTATANAKANPPAIALALNAPAVAVAPLLAALREPPYASGTIAIAADLHGAGTTPHAIAARLDGFMAATMSGGTIDTELLERRLPPAIARANVLGLLGGKGRSEIRCLALRLSATHGTATLAPFLLSSPLITVDGTGHIDLAKETLDLQLSPQGRVGGVGFSVPVSVSGGFRDPHVAVADRKAAAAGVQAALGMLAGRTKGAPAQGLQDALGLLTGKGRAGSQPAGPSCPAALAAARR